MRLSELLRREVVTESGLSLGKVHDLRGELGDERLRVTGLACGPMGFLERFGLGTGGTGGPSHAKVHDLRGELGDGRLRVTGLACGPMGFLERFGLGTGGTGGPSNAKVHGHPAIPWSRVLRVGAKIVIRD